MFVHFSSAKAKQHTSCFLLAPKIEAEKHWSYSNIARKEDTKTMVAFFFLEANQKEPSFVDRTFGAPLLAGTASASFGVANEGPRARLTGLPGLARRAGGPAREVNGIEEEEVEEEEERTCAFFS